jgi:hypothetical protein
MRQAARARVCGVGFPLGNGKLARAPVSRWGFPGLPFRAVSPPTFFV